MIYIGIDPGQSGGIAVIDTVPGGYTVYTTTLSGTERDIADWIAESYTGKAMGYLEGVHSFPGQGVASSFKFGMNYGFLRGVLIALELPFETVSPQRWQKAMGVPAKGKNETKTQHKNRLKAMAQQLFPTQKVTLATSDALLLAEYGRRLGLQR